MYLKGIILSDRACMQQGTHTVKVPGEQISGCQQVGAAGGAEVVLGVMGCSVPSMWQWAHKSVAVLSVVQLHANQVCYMFILTFSF